MPREQVRLSVCVCKLHEPGKAGDESQAQVAAMLSCIFSMKTSPSKTRVSVVSKNLVWLTNYVLSEVCNKKGRETKRERESERDQKNKRTIPKETQKRH